jgi:hypothetical protein
MNNVHALDRCGPRAARIAKVKFVALPMDLAGHENEACFARSGNATESVARVFTRLRRLAIRVIGRR